MKNRWMAAVTVVIIVGIAVVFAVTQASTTSLLRLEGASGHRISLVTSGTEYAFGFFGQHLDVRFSANASWTVIGSFIAVPNATLFIMNSTQYASFATRSSFHTLYDVTSFMNSSATVKYFIEEQGTYYLVWFDSSYSNKTTLVVTSSVALSPND